MKTIGGKIKEARKRKGLSLMELAQMLNISDTAISNIETGKTKSITVELGKCITKTLEISFNDLFDIEVPKNQIELDLITNIERYKEIITEKEKIIDLQEKVIQNFKNGILEAYDWSSSKDEIGIDAFLKSKTNTVDGTPNIHIFRQEFFQKLINWSCISKKDIKTYYDNKIKVLNNPLNRKD